MKVSPGQPRGVMDKRCDGTSGGMQRSVAPLVSCRYSRLLQQLCSHVSTTTAGRPCAAAAVASAAAGHQPLLGGGRSSDNRALFTREQVAVHNTEDDCWLIIGRSVYDVSSFLRSHPGGVVPVLPFAGKDATAVFEELHDPAWLHEFGSRYHVGTVAADEAAAAVVGPVSSRRPAGRRASTLPTPRMAGLFISPNPRAAAWPDGFPKALRWLHSRYVPRALPLPLSLRPLSAVPGASGGTGLHILHPQNWIEPDMDVFAREIGKKRKLLLDRSNRWYRNVFQAETDTRAEQQELLEVLIANLLTHHADQYSMSGRVITVHASGDAYDLDDWIGQSDADGKPIEIQLASLLVQEEFYILRRRGRVVGGNEVYDARDGTTRKREGVEEPYQYEFCAGTSCLNFIRAGIKGERGLMAPSNPMHTIHRPVPGMAEHGWHRRLAHIFSLMDEHTAYYRSNWGIDRDNRNTYYLDEENEFQTEDAVLAEYGEGTASLVAFRNRDFDLSRPVEEVAFISAEFQSMHRLPKTHALVFTLHKYFAPLSGFRQSPEAAAMLLRTLEATPKDKLQYQLGENEQWHRSVMEFLRDVADELA
eukprot:COSAG01_NODE_2497_length_7572_cov_3.992908_2_plen_589_part_00